MDLLLYLLILIIPTIAQIKISYSYSKYQKITSKKELTGFDVARKILDENGLDDIYVVEVSGYLTDHYDPKRKVVRLSKDVFHGNSIASVSVAAHECGHAIQDKENYVYMRIRSMLVPVVNFVSIFSWIIILVGLLIEYFQIFYIGIAFISLSLIFQLVTLPVEFNASSRAKKELVKLKLIDKKELQESSNMLAAAAMTYVASVLSSALEIIRLILIFNDNNR